MGNKKFRLSDMIPNAWFYKLRDMSKTRNSKSIKKKPSSFSTTFTQKPHLSQSKQPYYQTMESPKSCCKIQTQPRSFRVSDIDDLLPDLPRKSSLKKSRRKTIYKPSPKRMATSFASNDSKSNSSFPPPPLHHQDSLDHSSSESSFDIDFLIKSPSTEFASESSPCSCGFRCSAADIIIDVKDRTFVKSNDKLDAFDRIPVLDLPPIFTKPRRFNDIPDGKATNFSLISPQLQEIESLDDSLSIKFLKEESDRFKKGMMMKTITNKRAARKSASPPTATGIKLRTNSPRISSKKNHGQKRMNSSNKKEGLSDSFAVVKSSVDPEKDFKDSMMEMILENNIRASKDLEDLLACYLTLNSNEYHELIIKAFEQIWFNVHDLHL